MKKNAGFTIFEVVLVLIFLIAAGGWIANLIKLLDMNLEPLTALAIARIVGLLAVPLGSILGIFF